MTILDVSEFQGGINWAKVKADKQDIKAVIIRAGYRGYGSAGTLSTDKKFTANIKGASTFMPVGVYWWTTSLSDAEAAAEADYLVKLLKGYNVTLPVYLDSERSGTGSGRADGISKARRTQYGLTFCKAIKAAGYKPGLYCSEAWYTNDIDGAAFQREGYSIWIARYSNAIPNVKGYDGWQYTSKGKVDGIGGYCDLSKFRDDFIRAEPKPDGITKIIEVEVDGHPARLTSIEHKDENYVRLRDLATLGLFKVDWDGKKVIITSKKGG
jgi:GH25 family lysozyme M1 (1,4-beta-N-acetylmuramidase)